MHLDEYFSLWLTFPFFFSGIFFQVLSHCDLIALMVKRWGLAWLVSCNIKSCGTFIARVWVRHYLEELDIVYDNNFIWFFLMCKRSLFGKHPYLVWKRESIRRQAVNPTEIIKSVSLRVRTLQFYIWCPANR